MSTITVVLSDERLLKLKEMADNFGLAPEDLVLLSVQELLSRPDKAFQQAIGRVLEKNEELYRRLA